LNVHFAARLVGLFTRKSIVDTEVLGELLLGLLELVIVKKSIDVGNTKASPLYALAAGVSSAKRRRTNPRYGAIPVPVATIM
jgi:hypothetical protein